MSVGHRATHDETVLHAFELLDWAARKRASFTVADVVEGLEWPRYRARRWVLAAERVGFLERDDPDVRAGVARFRALRRVAPVAGPR